MWRREMCILHLFWACSTHQLLKSVVKKEQADILLFDKSLKSMCQSKQIDIHILSWNHDKHQAES